MRFFGRGAPASSPARQQPAAPAPSTLGQSSASADVEAGTSGIPVPGLTFRNSSRSSSPCAGSSVRSPDSRQPECHSPRGDRTQHLLSGRWEHGTPSQTPSKPGSRGKERHLCLLLLLLLPTLTGLAVMGVRLRMSEVEQRSLDSMPKRGRFNTGSGSSGSSFPSASASSSSSSNSRHSLHDFDHDSWLHKHSYQEMRERNRDRLPKWLRKPLKAAQDFFGNDPILKYLLPDGPASWMYQWLVKGRKNPAPLWDVQTFGPRHNEKFVWGSNEQLCSILNATDDVALVGNGPLSQEQREQISRAGRVVRFNALNNRAPGERTDIWVVRYNGMGPANYWGFKQLRYSEAEEVVDQASGVVFLGGHPTRFMAYAVEELLTWYPFVPVEKTIQVNITEYWDLYNQVLSDSTSLARAGAMPSSGLLGVLTTVACLRPDQKLRIFGFNWHRENWFMHKMDAEQKIIHRLLAGRQVEINPTACDGMYTCDKACDGLFYRLAKDGDQTVCEQRAKEEMERKKKEEDAQKMRNRQRAMDAMYGSTSYSRQAALEASMAAKKERESGPQVPDWVLDNSIKFKGKAVNVAASTGVTGSAASDNLLKQRPTLTAGDTKNMEPMGLEEREDGFLYNEHGEWMGSAEELASGSVAAAVHNPQQQDTSGIEQLAASELLALQDAYSDDPEAADFEYQDADSTTEDLLSPQEGPEEQEEERASQPAEEAAAEAEVQMQEAETKDEVNISGDALDIEDEAEQTSLADEIPEAAAESSPEYVLQQDGLEQSSAENVDSREPADEATDADAEKADAEGAAEEAGGDEEGEDGEEVEEGEENGVARRLLRSSTQARPAWQLLAT